MRVLAAWLFCGISALAEPDKSFVYQIFVRSFADSPTDTAADGGEIGDLRGVRENLPYLETLSAGILWLMPIFPSDTYHGYNIENYRDVNPAYGSIQDLNDLVKAAHARGMRVILDIAFNHTSVRHPWFQEALRDPNSEKAKFFHVVRDDASPRPPRWHVRGGVRYLGHFGPNMPDLNLDNPAVRRELKDIAKFWLNRGIDGFRLDAAKHVFDGDPAKNNEWWREFSEFVYARKADALLVGEVLGPAEALRDHAAGLGFLLDAPFLRAGRSYLVQAQPGFLKQWLVDLQSYRSARSAARPFHTWPFLGSHDETPRLASYLEMKAPDRVVQAYRLGLNLLFAIARYPVIYNGDELMQRGVKWRGNPPSAATEPGDGSRIYDETLREPFPWHKAKLSPPQTGWFPPRFDKPGDGISVEEQPASLDAVRSLAAFRARRPDFARSEITQILEDTADWLVFEKGRYLVVINPTSRGKSYAVPARWRKARQLFPSDGGESDLIPAYGMQVRQTP